jgi:hypothetical protein
MHLIHASTIQENEVIEITVLIVEQYQSFKKRIFKLKSEVAARIFFLYYNRGKGFHRSALNILKRFEKD